MYNYPRPGSHFDWSFLEDMPALETLQVAMVGLKDEWTLDRVAVNGTFRNSMFAVDGLVRNIMVGVLAHIEVKWNIWEELLKDFSTRSMKGELHVAEKMLLDSKRELEILYSE